MRSSNSFNRPPPNSLRRNESLETCSRDGNSVSEIAISMPLSPESKYTRVTSLPYGTIDILCPISSKSTVEGLPLWVFKTWLSAMKSPDGLYRMRKLIWDHEGLFGIINK